MSGHYFNFIEAGGLIFFCNSELNQTFLAAKQLTWTCLSYKAEKGVYVLNLNLLGKWIALCLNRPGSQSKWMRALIKLSSAHIVLQPRWFIQVTLTMYKHLWDWLSHGVYSRFSESKWVDSCNSSELYSALAEWMKGALAASSPHSPLGGLGSKDETRAPTKLLRDCPVTDSRCSRLIFAGNDGVIVNF